MMDARDVIARALQSIDRGWAGILWEHMQEQYPDEYQRFVELADAFEAALHDAGFAVVERAPLDDDRISVLAHDWANARDAAQAAYRFLGDAATRTAAQQIVDTLNAIEGQKWAALVAALNGKARP